MVHDEEKTDDWAVTKGGDVDGSGASAGLSSSAGFSSLTL